MDGTKRIRNYNLIISSENLNLAGVQAKATTQTGQIYVRISAMCSPNIFNQKKNDKQIQ
jgi:hypothetical protein